MASFKDPTFQDRTAAAAVAKQKALDRLKAMPAADPEKLAQQRVEWEAQQRLEDEERAAKLAGNAAAKAEKVAAKEVRLAEEKAAADLKAARLKPVSPEEMKAARDARYAARKARQ